MKYTLCTDLDRTLLPNGPQASDSEAIPLLHKLVELDYIQLIYVSGRDHQLILDAIESYDIPLPHMAITDVGTRIYHIDQNTTSDGKMIATWKEDRDWERYLARDWNNGKLETLKQQLDQHSWLKLQEPEKQSRFKISYYLDTDYYENDIESEITTICKHIDLKCNAIKSHDETTDTGLLDILPHNASKYHAIRFLMDKHTITEKEIVFCGDSGNDMEVLISEIPSVLVNNAQQSVKQQAMQLAAANHHSSQLYIASGGFCGLNGNYCSGILEGLAFYYQEFERVIGLYIPQSN